MYFIRTATERDLPAVRDLLVAAYRDTYEPFHGAEKVGDLNERWNALPVLKTLLADTTGEFLVADNGRRIGGMAYATPSRASAKTVGLVKLYVHPELKRQGIGQNLLAEIETCFPAADRVRLQVDIENVAALSFYQAHGFEIVGRTENCSTDESGMPAHLMEKAITPYG